VWVPQFQVIGDCIAAAEELMHGAKLKYGVPAASEYRKGKRKRPFGESDERNRKSGKLTDEGDAASPKLL
jgi:hypothetical protein